MGLQSSIIYLSEVLSHEMFILRRRLLERCLSKTTFPSYFIFWRALECSLLYIVQRTFQFSFLWRLILLHDKEGLKRVSRAFKRTAKSPYESRHFRFAQQHSQGPASRGAWGPFLETFDNFPGMNTILGAQYCPVAVEFLLILKAKF